MSKAFFEFTKVGQRDELHLALVKRHVDRRQLVVGRETVTVLVRQALNLSSDREADNVVNVVTDSIVAVITENIDIDGFTLKLPSFGKFSPPERMTDGWGLWVASVPLDQAISFLF